MPDIYQKGQPHRPWTSLTGHYMGMQAVSPFVESKLPEVWYRGDEHMALVARVADLERELLEARTERQREHDLRVKFQGEVEVLRTELGTPPRRPPKRMGATDG
jgi:hypothetical protein